MIKPPESTIFYIIEDCIKTYRRFAQSNIRQVSNSITVDQVLLLILIQSKPTLRQQELAAMLFKDNASITRITQLLIEKKYLTKKSNTTDRREVACKITNAGEKIIQEVSPIILNNRKVALEGISQSEIDFLDRILKKIISNCNQNKE